LREHADENKAMALAKWLKEHEVEIEALATFGSAS